MSDFGVCRATPIGKIRIRGGIGAIGCSKVASKMCLAGLGKGLIMAGDAADLFAGDSIWRRFLAAGRCSLPGFIISHNGAPDIGRPGRTG